MSEEHTTTDGADVRQQELNRQIATMLNNVVIEHELISARIAQNAGITSGLLSRILSGQHPVPPNVIRTLYHMTADPRLVELVFGDGARLAESNDDAATLRDKLTHLGLELGAWQQKIHDILPRPAARTQLDVSA